MSQATKIALGLVIASCATSATLSRGATLPTSGLILALGADSGVSTTAGSVTGWTDENSAAQKVNGTVGTPTLTTGVAFPNGSTHNVVAFNGSSGLALNTGTALSLQQLNIFVVANTTTDQTSGEFITNYHNNGVSNGWAVGNSDSNSGQLKWFTGPDGSDTMGGTTGQAVTPSKYYRINMAANPATGKAAITYDGINTESTTAGAYNSGANTIPYDGSELGSVGFLNVFGGIQFLKGNIAEILVYNDTGLSSGQIAAETANVNAYLDVKYLVTPEPASLGLIGFAGLGLLARRRRGD